MKKEMTVTQATRKIEIASAKHDRMLEQKTQLFNKFINKNNYEKSTNALKKLNRQTTKVENAWYAYFVSIKNLANL
jgi:hypothetical protein